MGIFLATLFLLSTVSIGAVALEPKQPVLTAELEYQEITHFDPTTQIDVPMEEQKIPFYGQNGNAALPYRFYSFLNTNQKFIYDTILSNPLQEQIPITFPEPMCIPSSPENHSGNFPSALQNLISEAVAGGMSAAADDHPEIFWINGYQMSMGARPTTENVPSGYDGYIVQITIYIGINTDAYANFGVVEDYYNRIKAYADAFEVKGETRYEKVKYIHDFIAHKVNYDDNFVNPMAHEPTSVFFSDTTVCEGYSEAFKILCDKANIPCLIVVGTAYTTTGSGGHAWNYVKMEDNQWYGMDLTWDDKGNTLYDYFLVGTHSTNSNFDDKTFSQAHVSTGKHYGKVNFSLTYPTLSETAYSKFVAPGPDSNTIIDATRNYIFVDNGNEMYRNVDYPKGVTKTGYGGQTGTQYSVTDGVTTVYYTIIMRGDTVPNSYVQVDDYNRVARMAVGDTNEPQSNTPEYAAGDLNSDGKVDALDTAQMDLLLSSK